MNTQPANAADIGARFLSTARATLSVEYRTKLRHAVAMLPDAALWNRTNDDSNSVGNLLLHLAGNIRQWIVGGVGRQPNVRNRAAEFAAQAGASKAELLADLERALDEVDATERVKVGEAGLKELIERTAFAMAQQDVRYYLNGLLFDLRCDGIRCIGGTRFGWFLLAKVILAFGVLGVFVNAVWTGARGRMNACRFRHTHRIVLALMVLIVFLAKTMFYL